VDGDLGWGDVGPVHQSLTGTVEAEATSRSGYLLNSNLESYHFTKLTNSMGLTSSLEAASSAPTQEIPNVLWNPKFHYSVHKSPPLVPILSHVYPVNTTSYYLESILILSTHVRLGLPSGLFPSGFSTNIIHKCLLVSIRATCPTHLILLHLIILIILGRRVQVIKLLIM
jgi:hypothetical protein